MRAIRASGWRASFTQNHDEENATDLAQRPPSDRRTALRYSR